MKLIYLAGLAIVLTLFPEKAFTQKGEVDLTVSTPYKPIKDGWFWMYSSETYLIALTLNDGELSYQTFDPKTLNESYRTALEVEGRVLGHLRLAERIFIIHTKPDKRREILNVHMKELDPVTGELGSSRLLMETPYLKGKKDRLKSWIDWNVNADQTEVIVWSNYNEPYRTYYAKNLTRGMKYVRLDSDLQVISEGLLNFSAPSNFSYIYSLALLKNNEFIINYVSVPIRMRDQPDWSSRTMENYLVSEGNIMSRLATAPTDNYLTELRSLEIGDERYLLGFYSQSKRPQIEGLYFSNVTEVEGHISTKLIEIPDELLNAYEVKYKNPITSLWGKPGVQIVKMEDGELMIILDFNDLYVFRLDAQLNVKWIRKLPKLNLYESSTRGATYEYQFIQDKHVFVVVDNPENNDLDAQSPAYYSGYKLRKDILRAFIIDEDGEVSQKVVTHFLDIKGYEPKKFLLRTDLFSLSNGKFLFKVYTKDKENILVKFEVFD